jgi:hypothetical protein
VLDRQHLLDEGRIDVARAGAPAVTSTIRGSLRVRLAALGSNGL